MGYPEAVPHHRVDSTQSGLKTTRIPRPIAAIEYKPHKAVSNWPSVPRFISNAILSPNLRLATCRVAQPAQ